MTGAVLAAFLGVSACGAAPVQPDDEVAATIEPVVIPRSQTFLFESESLGRSYQIEVKLPPGYTLPENAERRYPVLYLNDATYNFQTAAGVTHYPMNYGTVEPFILVGVGYEAGADPVDSRIRDYTPSVDATFARETGGAEPYLGFFENELIPEIETRYRADPQRRVLGGHSLGGLFGAYVLFERPGLFEGYILSSPSFWFDEREAWNIEAAYADGHDDLEGRVYVSIGGLEHPNRPGGPANDMVADVFEFERRLLSRNYEGLEIRATSVEGANHETVFPTVLMNGVLWHFNAKPDVPFGF